jgi:ataxia telangiectasia mutated family protein
MEQVFEMTNRILSRDRKTKARDLRFRRYTVIPLPNRSGVMEFVGDSMAIGEYLKPAHTKLVPSCYHKAPLTRQVQSRSRPPT